VVNVVDDVNEDVVVGVRFCFALDDVNVDVVVFANVAAFFDDDDSPVLLARLLLLLPFLLLLFAEAADAVHDLHSCRTVSDVSVTLAHSACSGQLHKRHLCCVSPMPHSAQSLLFVADDDESDIGSPFWPHF